MKGLSLEAKVGLLILAAAILLGVFLFALGGINLENTYTVYVDFDNPGSVQPGAAVRVGGVKVGSVDSVQYLGRRQQGPRGERSALVRLTVAIHEDVRDTIHRDAIFYVTSQGVLGEQFLAVDPGSVSEPALEEGAILEGVDPPRLDLALALGYELLETLVDGVRENREELGALVDDVVALVHGLRLLLTDNRGDLDAIVDNIRTLSGEGVTTLRSARENYVDGPRPQRILANLDRSVAQAPAVMTDVREAAHDANEVLDTFGPDQRQQIQNTIASAERISNNADTAVADAQGIVHHMREGRGTIGSLMMDEEIYDDLQELVRDLKHNPWKFFWRE